MAKHLLVVILIYSFSEINAQALPPPTLTVNPPVITETDSVTLHCQTPPSVSVSHCYFYTLSGGTRVFPCLETLTGTELLLMSQQRSPAEVQVKCFYTVKHGGSTSLSPHSDPSSITVHNSFHKIQTQAPLPPTLTVNPPVITETDSVTLHCQTPPSVSVSQCYFYTLSGLTVRVFPCLKTLTGTELLLMSQQRSPAEVQVKCFYNVTFEGSNSPHSDPSSITIYNIVENNSSTTQSIAPSKDSTGLTVISPYPLPPVTPAKQTSGWTVVMSKNTGSSSSSSPTPVKAASAEIWKFVAVVVAGCGVTVGVILLVSAILCNNRRTET
ncbi:uncharacterized protein LOC117489647 [Trematomus bernacchii]|uniref:uncharacterized protein LOC117489647 n=1 Tax=Trematomus bernacchii TaxID=40690 RepID=UPI00146CB503|nr:uncharacterized protein LOC117489647 [Trematomus bernacchii]